MYCLMSCIVLYNYACLMLCVVLCLSVCVICVVSWICGLFCVCCMRVYCLYRDLWFVCVIMKISVTNFPYVWV